jgi:hypothetical protein
MAKLELLNEVGVAAGGGVPSGAGRDQRPITGWALLSVGRAFSSSAVTSMVRVRLACAGNW